MILLFEAEKVASFLLYFFSLQEKIADMEAEDQMLRQKVMLKLLILIQKHYFEFTLIFFTGSQH